MPVRPARLATAMRPLAALARRRRPFGGRTSGQVQVAPEVVEEPPSPIERLTLARSAREEELAAALTGVVRRGDVLAEPHRKLLPGQRRDGNLAEVAGVLDAAGLAHGIVPDRNPRHRLAIAPGDRAAVLEALSATFAGQAVYADLLEHGRTLGTVLAEQLPAAVALMEAAESTPDDEQGADDEQGDGAPEEGAAPDGNEGQDETEEQVGPTWPADRVKGVRIYRPAAVGTLLYGPETGCDVEFWDSAAPSPGAIASIDETPFGWWVPSLAATATKTVDGRPYPLLDVFATDLPDQVTFPIDAVITWVDDADPAWQERRAAARERLAHTAAPIAAEDGVAASGIAGDADQRFRNRDELRYCLRALAAHAPWIRQVYLVTDDQVPHWLDTDAPGLTVVSHRELFAGTGAGPVFNSHAIESRLHMVPGLAEHFLYVNDDVFLGRTLVPEDFFLGNGLPRYFPDGRIIPPGPAEADDSVYVAALKNTRATLAAAVGKTYPRTLKHTPHPLRRSVLAESAEKFADELRGTVGSAFRAATDLAPVTLAIHYAHATARSVEGQLSDGYFVTDSNEDLARLAELREERWADCFCLADGTHDQLSPEEQEEAVAGFLRAYFPVPSPFESAEAIAADEAAEAAAAARAAAAAEADAAPAAAVEGE
ncbi:stealth family protein [Kitasatospora brasiliensis]|uniref:stealth family protein n=1 Tax=Kitasatospora brasiliensis TaxID=3058040 RepID=UPI00292D0646|nr:stealth family protein [Kitasatospora sp. K002]